MKEITKGKLPGSRLRTVLTGAILMAGLCLVATTATATAIITASVGGVPNGADRYETFDTASLGSGGFTSTDGKLSVSFTGDAQAVQGASDGHYAAPFLSGGNGLNFGGQPNGPDASIYLATGAAGSDVTLALDGPVRYMGLLWGSVDAFNTLTFYSGSDIVASLTGADVTATANGAQDASGTYYVNIILSDSFDRVVASSSSYAFEFDNVAFSKDPIGVPEPGTAGVFLLGLLLLGSGYWFKRREFRKD